MGERCRWQLQPDTRVRVKVRGRGVGSWRGSVRLLVAIFNSISLADVMSCFATICCTFRVFVLLRV